MLMGIIGEVKKCMQKRAQQTLSMPRLTLSRAILLMALGHSGLTAAISVVVTISGYLPQRPFPSTGMGFFALP